MESKVIEDAIAKVRGNGFYSGATERRLRRIVANLRVCGISCDLMIAEIIMDFWATVSVEYDE
jgi:hypothetical protein